jgi:hypothetical protein
MHSGEPTAERVDDPAMAVAATGGEAVEAPGPPLLLVMVAGVVLVAR